MQTTNVSSVIKIFYPDGDHSAIQSSVSGMYDSKWGSAPLMRHAPGYGPYTNMANRWYFEQKFYYGLIEGEGEPSLGVSNTYVVPLYSSVNYIWSIANNRGDDVNVPMTSLGNAIYITFTQRGVYELYCNLYYAGNNQHIGTYSFEILAGY